MNKNAIILTLTLSAGACASQPPPPPTYIRAEPIKEAPRKPAVVQVPKPMPLPGQLRRIPTASAPDAGANGTGEPWAVVDDANKKAAQNPEESGYFNAIMAYDFAPGALFQVYTAPMRITDIQLQPGEKVLGKPAIGDNVRWVMGLGKSAVNGVEQQHIYLKTTRPGLHTTLVVNTDRRTYLLEVHSYKDTYMAAVTWRYPQDEIAQLEAQSAADDAKDRIVTATNINLDSVYFGYAIKVHKGKPRWTPVQVFDDGRKTFIRFPSAMLVREAPALFVLSREKQTQLVNYRVRNEYYIVDRLFDNAELRLGERDQDIVRISRHGN